MIGALDQAVPVPLGRTGPLRRYKAGQGRIVRGLGFIAHRRETVFGPLIQQRHGKLPQGARRLEAIDPDAATHLDATLCGHDSSEIGRAVLACVRLYRQRTDDIGIAFQRNHDAASLAVRYLDGVVGRIDLGRPSVDANSSNA